MSDAGPLLALALLYDSTPVVERLSIGERLRRGVHILGGAVADERGVSAWVRRDERDLKPLYQAIRKAAADGRSLVVHNDALACAQLRSKGVIFGSALDTAGLLRAEGSADGIEDGAALVGRSLPARHGHMLDLQRKRLQSELAARAQVVHDLGRRAQETLGELELWVLSSTTAANAAGIAIDTEHAEKIAEQLVARKNEALETLSTSFPNFNTSDLSRPDRLVRFCRHRFGIDLPSVSRKNSSVAAKAAENASLSNFLTLTRTVSTTTTYINLTRRLAAGSARVHGHLRYWGAHTGRFSSGGTDADNLNIQALPGGRTSLPELGEVRRVLIPEPGERWVAADLATIEPRILAHLAGQEDLLKRFRAGDDVYIWFANKAFPGERVVKGGENAHLRALSKEAIIGLGYCMGVDTFHDLLSAKSLGVERDEATRLWKVYRRSFPRVKALWRSLWLALEASFHGHEPDDVGGCRFRREPERHVPGEHTVTVTLPTGRALRYRALRRTVRRFDDGHATGVFWFAAPLPLTSSPPSQPRAAPAIDEKTRVFEDGVLRRRLTKPVLVENIVQAIARDLLMAMAYELDQRGLRPVFSVHDELVVATEACACADGHGHDCSYTRAREVVAEVMSSVPAILPGLSGLPVACELSSEVEASFA